MLTNTHTVSLMIIGILGIANVVAALYVFRHSVVRNLVLLISGIIVYSVAVGIVSVKYGFIHFTWAIPVGVGICWGIFFLMARYIRKPISEVSGSVERLSRGDVKTTFETDSRKNEITDMFSHMNELSASLNAIVAFAENIGRGNLDVDYQLLGDDDALGKAMLQMRDNLKAADEEKQKRQEEDERRNWVSVGLARFAELLRSNNDHIENFCHAIISNLVKYIGANQGGIFILNDTTHPVLELKACYAYERRKYLQKEIEPGEGLVGTCFLERQSIYMTDIPKDYIHITSGLGDETPRALLIVPLVMNDEVYGVIEIAAFKAFEPHVKEFIDKLAESVASTVSSVKTTIRTQRLLEQSKLQTEELVNQEEELRQNMEEMQATQEELRMREEKLNEALKSANEAHEESHRREIELQRMHKLVNGERAELNAVIGSIDKEFLRITYDIDMKLIDINNSAVRFHGVPREQLLGTKITDNMPPEEIELFTRNWNEMLDGIILKGEGERLTAEGMKHIWYMYSPVMDSSGEPDKVIMMGQEII